MKRQSKIKLIVILVISIFIGGLTIYKGFEKDGFNYLLETENQSTIINTTNNLFELGAQIFGTGENLTGSNQLLSGEILQK